jgi:hypothetical protein
MIQSILKTETKKIYKYTGENGAYGYMILEKSDEIWNIEIFFVQPKYHGHGMKFLQQVLEAENLNIHSIFTNCIAVDQNNYLDYKHFFNKMKIQSRL